MMAMRLAIGWVALVALACVGCAEETCELVPADDGSIVVRCNGSEIPIERCEDDLPDLDGDGEVDDEDCAQREVGRFTREVCEALPAYSQLALCHGPVRHDLGYEVRTAAVGTAFFGRWHLAMATSRVTPMGLWAVAIWIDRDDDGRPDGTEQHALPGAGLNANLTIGSGMCLSVASWSYNVEAPGSESVAYWRDVSCDTVLGEQEVATLVLRSPGARTVSNMVALPRGLAFTETFADGRTNLVAWIDADGDLAVDLDERTIVASGTGVHLIGPAPSPDAGELLYRDREMVLLWRPGAAVQAVSPTAAFARCDTMVLHGPGGGCLADGDVIERGSWSMVGQEAIGELHAPSSSTSDGTTTALSFRTRSSIVIRGALDGRATRAERSRDREFAVGPEIGMIAEGQPQFLIGDGLGHWLERWRPLRVTRFLNEACDAETTCASGLTCAVSGNATEARCVAAAEP